MKLTDLVVESQSVKIHSLCRRLAPYVIYGADNFSAYLLSF